MKRTLPDVCTALLVESRLLEGATGFHVASLACEAKTEVWE